MKTKEEKKGSSPSVLNSLLFTCMGLAFAWAYQFTGLWPSDNMFGISWPRILVLSGVLVVLTWMISRYMEEMYDLFASVHFASVNGIFLGIFTILGTLIKQDIPKEETLQTYGVTGTKIIENLFLGKVFFSIAFETLLFFLVVGLILVTIKRKQFTPDKFGFFLAHAGVVILILGGWMGRTKGWKETMTLRVGEKKSLTDSFADKMGKQLDFTVELKKFEIDYYPAEAKLDVFQMSKDHKDIKRIATLKVKDLSSKKVVKVPGCNYEVQMLRYYPDLGMERKMVEVSDEVALSKKNEKHSDHDGHDHGSHGHEEELITPVVSLDYAIEGKDGKEEQNLKMYALISQQNYITFPNNKLLVFSSAQEPQEGFEKIYLSGNLPGEHLLHFTFQNSKDKKQKKNPDKIKVELGKVYQLGQCTLETLRFFPHLSVNMKEQDKEKRVYNRSPDPVNPALEVKLTFPGEAPIKIWLYAKHSHNHDEILKQRGLDLRYIYSPPAQGFDSYLFVLTKSKRFLEVRNGKIFKESKIQPAYSLKDLGIELKNVRISYSKIEMNPYSISDKMNNPGAEVLILQKGKPLQPAGWVYTRENSFLISADQKILIQMKKDEPVKSYKSLLVIHEKDKKVMEKLIQVNDPLWYKGYALYQSSHQGTEVSGLQVVNDPGLAIVLLGMFFVFLGIPYIFYIQPALVVRKKNKLKETYLASNTQNVNRDPGVEN